MKLRPYQERGIEECRDHIKSGRRRVILCSPTGGGKTVLAASIIQSARTKFNAKALFVAHRKELIDQAVRQLARWGVTEVGVIRAEDARSNPLMPVQVASIQTLVRREIAFAADIVFVDECHRACADSYTKSVFDAYPNAIHIGLTATPYRSDQKPLGRGSGGPYDAIVQAATYMDLQKDGFLSALKCFSVPERMKPDLSGVRTSMGDFNLEELEKVMVGGALVGGIYERWLELHDIPSRDGGKSLPRKTVIFATSRAHSMEIVKKFHEEGVKAAHLDGDTPEDLREEILAKLDRGDLQVVSNCQILTEGWDQPNVKCVIVARPTKSVTLYRQMNRIGRPCCECGHPPGDHNSDNNKNTSACTKCGCVDLRLITPVFLDHGANFDRHGRPDEDVLWNIEGPPKRTAASKFKLCPKCYAYIPSSARECEHCAHVFAHESIKPKLPPEVTINLVERTAVDEARQFYDRHVRLARTRGYKPGFASWKYKEKYGNWPPWSWSEQTRQELERDPIWQTNRARTEKFRREREMTAAELEEAQSKELDDLANELFQDWDDE